MHFSGDATEYRPRRLATFNPGTADDQVALAFPEYWSAGRGISIVPANLPQSTNATVTKCELWFGFEDSNLALITGVALLAYWRGIGVLPLKPKVQSGCVWPLPGRLNSRDPGGV